MSEANDEPEKHWIGPAAAILGIDWNSTAEAMYPNYALDAEAGKLKAAKNPLSQDRAQAP